MLNDLKECLRQIDIMSPEGLTKPPLIVVIFRLGITVPTSYGWATCKADARFTTGPLAPIAPPSTLRETSQMKVALSSTSIPD